MLKSIIGKNLSIEACIKVAHITLYTMHTWIFLYNTQQRAAMLYIWHYRHMHALTYSYWGLGSMALGKFCACVCFPFILTVFDGPILFY